MPDIAYVQLYYTVSMATALPYSTALTPAENRLVNWVEAHARGLIALALLVALVWTVIFLQFTVDDAYISFRYAKNLVVSHTWNWNPSGAPSEAYTSFLYTALAIVPTALHIPVALFFKFFGLLCIATMVYRVFTQADSRFTAVICLLLIGLDPRVWNHAYAGLETPLYMLLLLEVGLCVRNARAATTPYICLLALLLPLTRPEGTVFAVAGAALFIHERYGLPSFRRYFLAAGLAGLMYFVWRVHHFGSLLPNPFYIKATHFRVSYLLQNLETSRFLLFALCLALCVMKKGSVRLYLFCVLCVMLVLFEPNPMMMNYADRFYFQLVLPAVLLFLLAGTPRLHPSVSLVVVALVLLSTTRDELGWDLTYFPYLQKSHVDLGKRLAPFSKNHTMLLGDAGAVPYFSNWVAYDFLGLCTTAVAKHGLDKAATAKINPDLILLYSHTADPHVEFEIDQNAMLNYMGSSGAYEYVGASRWRDFYLVSFLKRNTPDHDAIKQAIQVNTEVSAHNYPTKRNIVQQAYVPLQ